MTNPPATGLVDRRSLYKKLAISLLPALAFVWVLKSGGLPLLPAREDLAKVDPGGIVLFLVVWFAHYFVRTGRWYFLLAPIERVPVWTVIRVACIGFFAVSLLPFRMGEAVRPLLIRREGGRLTGWAATGTVGAERAVDGLSISLILLTSLYVAKPLDPLPERIGDLPVPAALVPGAAYAMALVFAGGCAVMVIFYFWRVWARKMTEAVIGVVSKPLATWLATRVEQVAEGLGFLRQPRYAVPFLLSTILYWTLNASTWWVLARACGLDIGFFGAAATMGVVALGILVPATPGFFGAFQLAIYCGLAMYLAPEIVMRQGSVYSFLGYALPIGLSIVVGLAALAIRPRTENLAGSSATG